KGYGDCKDKACLMQSLLRSVGIESHPVLVYSGDPTRIQPQFPSALQFNHAIVAIEVKGELEGAGNLDVSTNVIFFDPSDSRTPLGDLPFYVQGGLGLAIGVESGELLRLPSTSEEANRAVREMTVRLGDNWRMEASVKEVLTGQMAAIARRRAST